MKLKTWCLSIFALFLWGIAMDADAAGIRFFKGTWQQALEKAKADKKLIFVDVYTQWCGPCYNMAHTVFLQPDVSEFYNAHFINVQIDAEHGEGVPFARKYQVRLFPTYLFIDPASEKAVHYSSSRQSEEQFIATGQAALTPSQRSFYLNEEYGKGNRSRQLLIDYINYNHSIYNMPAVTKAFGELIASGAKLTDKDVWDVFNRTITGMDNPYLREVSDHYEQFCQLFGKATVDAKLQKETTYGDLNVLDKLCNFEGKAFNRELIVINGLINGKKYTEAANRIDSLIADPKTDQQALIARLKFMTRVSRYNAAQMPDEWFNKCIEYQRYIAYNQADRDDPHIHQEYAAALELMINRYGNGKLPAFIQQAPRYGKKEYSMRPDALKPKPRH